MLNFKFDIEYSDNIPVKNESKDTFFIKLLSSTNSLMNMRFYSIFFTLILFYQLSFTQKLPRVDTAEANKAFRLLQEIRKQPHLFVKDFPFIKKYSISKIMLRWNDTLARVAQSRAMDMANRNYFDHVNPNGIAVNYLMHKSGYKLPMEWVEDKRQNYFESITAGGDGGEEGIRRLIIDKNVSNLGHRKHLLGLDDWNASLYDIGIGFVLAPKSNTYPTYMVVIIAKHDW